MCHHFEEAGPAQGHVIYAIQVHSLPSLCSPNGIELIPCGPCLASKAPVTKLAPHCSCCHRAKNMAAWDDASHDLSCICLP